ncbi:Oxygen-evolving enhancer protein 3 [Dillenia turbinata]|uniref:Oxygen-evolving enhancer protein 3 n=1 Tax=Dillenia turbinata TaxID=194707 RepID=A0AAN8ZDD6_9MAGN
MVKDAELKGSTFRLKKCACDLLSIQDDLMDDDDASWDYIGSNLHLKSTLMYCDFNRVITKVSEDQKKILTEVANKLFGTIEELDEAVKVRSISLAQDRCNEVALVLLEVVALIT